MATRRGFLSGLTATAGCAPLGPEFKRPDVDLQAQFLSGGSGGIGDVSKDAWWTDFRDSMLNQLLQENVQISNASI